jgi:5'-deoxynucleotidase YfbR-like HD superfamily hydrolase
MLADTSLEKEFSELLAEYEKRDTLEAKIVKDADILDVDMELQEQASAGHTLAHNWETQRDHVGTKLFTKAAKELQKELRAANPHDWHIESPNNRLNGGDWKRNDA